MKVTGESGETAKMQFPDFKSWRNWFLPCQTMRTLQVLSGSSERPHLPAWFKMPSFMPQVNLSQKPRHTRKRAWLPHCGLLCLYTVLPSTTSLVCLFCWVGGISRGSAGVVEWGGDWFPVKDSGERAPFSCCCCRNKVRKLGNLQSPSSLWQQRANPPL